MLNADNMNVEHISSLQSAQSSKPIQVISVTGGKGGVGKTSMSINLGITMAEAGKRVLIFDADLSLSNVDVLLGLNPQKNISHVLSGECTLADIVITGPAGIQIIPASSGVQSMSELSTAELGGLIQAFSDLDQNIDVMIVDTAAGISNQVMNFVRACQENIIVVCNEPSSITDAYALIKVLHQKYQCTRFQILSNMTRTHREGLEISINSNTLPINFLILH